MFRCTSTVFWLPFSANPLEVILMDSSLQVVSFKLLINLRNYKN